jgi:chlorite dismutase
MSEQQSSATPDEQRHAAERTTPARRSQFTRFAFFKVAPEWRRLPAGEREQQKQEFAAIVEELRDHMMVRGYSTIGTRGDCDFLLWQAAYDIDTLHDAATRIRATALGRYLSMSHSFLAMTRRSIYIEKHAHPGQEGARLRLRPTNARFLFVYPFVKTRAWYALSKEQRQEMMDEHIAIGHKYPSVRLNTTYSFGLDDQEFVLAFEGSVPEDFVQLVMELRESRASSYTERDTPIFTCLSLAIAEMLDALDGASALALTGLHDGLK